MEFLIKLMLGGGLYAILGFIHFFTDWIFQSHAEAMVKHANAKVRAKHCAIYTLGFVPLLTFCFCVGALMWWQLLACLVILFVSHFYEDTYYPVFLWAKYIRRPPQMTEPIKEESSIDGYVKLKEPNAKAGFVQFIDTTLGKILMITVDQIIHFVFLFPLVYFVMSNIHINMDVFTK